jgi:hypothetical protein
LDDDDDGLLNEEMRNFVYIQPYFQDLLIHVPYSFITLCYSATNFIILTYTMLSYAPPFSANAMIT